MRVSQNWGYLLGILIIRAIVFRGSTLGFPYSGKVPYI